MPAPTLAFTRATASLFHLIAAICARLGVPENKDLFEDFSLYDDR